MHRYLRFVFAISVAAMLVWPGLAREQKAQTPEQVVAQARWYGQAAMRFVLDGKVVYIDPYRLTEQDSADIILITHSHRDHLSPVDIAKILRKETILIVPLSCKKEVSGIAAGQKIYCQAGEEKQIGAIRIQAVPAYNRQERFHPRQNEWLGFVLTAGGVRIYHAGDTDRIPEMKNITCDVACLPLGQTYTMRSVEDAAAAALDTKAKIAIPMHYGLAEGSPEDAQKFKKILEGKVDVVILRDENAEKSHR